MKNDLIDFFEKDLQTGEKVLWSGQPEQGFLVRRSEFIFIPLSIIFCCLSFWLEGWIINLIIRASPIIYDTTGLLLLLIMVLLAILCFPLVMAGLFVLVGRFIFDRIRRKKTIYALTDQRVLIGSSMLKHRVKSVPIEKKIQPRLEKNKHERGTVFLSMDAFLWWFLVGPPWWLPFWPDVEVYQPPFLERVESSEEVYQKIIEMITPDQYI